jgi:hypothetical protein
MAELSSRNPEQAEKPAQGAVFSQFLERHPELNIYAPPASSEQAKSAERSSTAPADKSSAPSREEKTALPKERSSNSTGEKESAPSYQLPKIDLTDRTNPSSTEAPEEEELSPTEPVPRTPQSWKDKHSELVKKAESKNLSLAFYGDSITEGMSADNALKKSFGDKADNFGIVGDSTQHLLWRLQHGEANFKQKPEEAVLLIGANNVGKASSEDIVKGILANVAELQKQMPDTKLLVLGVLPQGKTAGDPRREEIKNINDELQKQLAGRSNVSYFDVGPKMLEKDGSMSPKIWWGDGLHPRDYSPMFNEIKPVLEKMKKSN